MNTTFGEVLQEVLTGFLITEPNVKKSRIRGRCLGMKRVSRWSRFAIRCHAQLFEREREREGERIEKHHHTPEQFIKRRKGTYV